MMPPMDRQRDVSISNDIKLVINYNGIAWNQIHCEHILIVNVYVHQFKWCSHVNRLIFNQ